MIPSILFKSDSIRRGHHACSPNKCMERTPSRRSCEVVSADHRNPVSAMDEDRRLSSKELKAAYRRFRALLETRTVEDQWQDLFAENPFILTRALPLQLDPREIVPLGRRGKSEADFLFFQRMGSTVTAYGAIELKRPDSKILTFPRKDLVLLTRDADTAIKQASKYADNIVLPTDSLFLGCPRHLFVIMGLSEELTTAFSRDIVRAEYDGLLPQRCELLPYDTLLRRFESTLPKDIIVLVPALPRDEEALITESETDRRDSLIRILGNKEAFSRLRVRATYALRRFGPVDPYDVDDFMQDALVRLLEDPPRVSNLDEYFMRAVRALAIRRMRRDPQHLEMREALQAAWAYNERTQMKGKGNEKIIAQAFKRPRVHRRKTP